MASVTVEFLKKPNVSKGWGRYSLKSGAAPVVTSNTGNHWISSTKTGSVEPGAEMVLTIQSMNKHGKGRTYRETVYTTEFRLVAEEGASVELSNDGGAQHTFVRVVGARLLNPAAPRP